MSILVEQSDGSLVRYRTNEEPTHPNAALDPMVEELIKASRIYGSCHGWADHALELDLARQLTERLNAAVPADQVEPGELPESVYIAAGDAINDLNIEWEDDSAESMQLIYAEVAERIVSAYRAALAADQADAE